MGGDGMQARLGSPVVGGFGSRQGGLRGPLTEHGLLVRDAVSGVVWGFASPQKTLIRHALRNGIWTAGNGNPARGINIQIPRRRIQKNRVHQFAFVSVVSWSAVISWLGVGPPP